MAIEKPSYEVLERGGDLELRRYEPYIVAETLVGGSFDEAGNKGFRRLADYIFGNNHSQTKLAMTAPVNMHREEDLYRVTFMMPSGYTLETLPEPVSSNVRLRQMAGELIAVVRYGGTWSQQRYESHKAKLEDWVAARGWSTSGEPIFARYDPPFMPWFLRRNEILIPLEEPSPSLSRIHKEDQ